MTPERSRFLRDNAFLVAAVALPVVVVGFFLVASALPRWRVPPPAYDLLLKANAPYDYSSSRVAVEVKVRDGRVEATIRPLPAPAYVQRPALLLFEHETMDVREIRFEVPELEEDDPPKTIVIEALAGRRVLEQTTAPDGYGMDVRSRRGSPGFVGELFGMGQNGNRPAIVNRGRVVPLPLPAEYRGYYTSVSAIGWLVDRGQ